MAKMIDPKLMDALAERLLQEFEMYADIKRDVCLINRSGCDYVASRLLESVPGEEELARMLKGLREKWVVEYTGNPSLDSSEEVVARFLHSKIAGWVR